MKNDRIVSCLRGLQVCFYGVETSLARSVLQDYVLVVGKGEQSPAGLEECAPDGRNTVTDGSGSQSKQYTPP